jgi:PAS domain S-box-containing protein
MMWPLKSDYRANGLEMIPTPDTASRGGDIRRVMAVTRPILNLLLFSTAFFLAYLYGMSFHHISSAPFWPPDAVLLCALLLTPRRKWWLYLLAPLPIRLLVAVPPDTPAWFLLAVYANDSLKAIISAALLKRLNHGTPRLTSMHELVQFFAVAVLGVPALSAFGGAASRLALGDSFWAAWQMWFLGDALANLLLTPTILYWSIGGASALRSAGLKRFVEGITLTVALILVGAAAFSGADNLLGDSPAVIYLPFPILLWAAVRFGPRGVSSALSLIAVFAIWNMELGRGPFSANLPGGNLLSLQLFLCVISIPLLCLTVLLQERQRVGESLRETTAQLARTEDFSLVMVTKAGLDGRWLKVPPTLCELLGYTEEELLGGYFKDVTHPDDFEADWRQCQRLIDGEIKSFDLEKRYIHKDGRIIWVYLNCSVVTDDCGRPVHFLTYIKDITERRLAEETIKRINAELEQRISRRTAELRWKTRELETFAYSVAHDLKAPLRGIEGYSGLLLEDYLDKLDKDGRAFLYGIHTSTARMNQLIDDLLAYSMIERRELTAEAIELRPFMEMIVGERKPEMEERGINLTMRFDGGVIVADPEGLSQALRNYLDNAIKFTGDAPEPRIEIGAEENEKKWRLWVSDNGVGFDMLYHDWIFEIFHRVHRMEDYPGTGVGLALVRKAMERMGGRAWAESVVGQGATFYLEIPRSHN